MYDQAVGRLYIIILQHYPILSTFDDDDMVVIYNDDMVLSILMQSMKLDRNAKDGGGGERSILWEYGNKVCAKIS